MDKAVKMVPGKRMPAKRLFQEIGILLGGLGDGPVSVLPGF